MSSRDKKRILVLNDDDNPSSPSKKRKEICSFKEQCFRKNPHHFMEYSHPHLEILLDLNEDELNLNIPDSYLEKSVVMDQLKILREIKAPKKVWQDFSASTSTQNSEYSTSSTTTSTSSKTLADKVTFASKLKSNAPYNLFFTVIPDSPQTRNQNNSLKITDLLCPSLGKLKCSLQINFMIDIMWLMEQYSATGNEKKPLTVLYGEDFPKMQEYMNKFLPNVTHHLIKMKDPFGTHHSKVGVYAYEDGSLRVVISTANLYYEDWNIYCQGVWVSPVCPLLPKDAPDTDGAGPTDFKTSLMKYLRHYDLPCLNDWIKKIKRVDFSSIKYIKILQDGDRDTGTYFNIVFFVSTVPGKHSALGAECHLQRVGDLLSRHCNLPQTKTAESEALRWNVIAQSSSLGNFGSNPAAWLRTALLRSLASHKKQPMPGNSNAKLNIIFPTINNVLGSYHGPEGGGCLPYSKVTHEKQKWLESYLHEWKADRTNRTRAMPHVKSYCRVSPDFDKLAYFLLTSANISKAAWGTLNKTDSSSYCRSYEVGVLFLPSFFNEEYFPIDPKKITSNQLFPFMYDLPLVPYKSDDTPWAQ